MVKVCRQGHAAAQDVFGCEVDVDGLGAAGGLGIVTFDAAYESLVVLDRDVGVEVKVVADTFLRAFDLQDGVEVDDLISGAEGEAA